MFPQARAAQRLPLAWRSGLPRPLPGETGTPRPGPAPSPTSGRHHAYATLGNTLSRSPCLVLWPGARRPRGLHGGHVSLPPTRAPRPPPRCGENALLERVCKGDGGRGQGGSPRCSPSTGHPHPLRADDATPTDRARAPPPGEGGRGQRAGPASRRGRGCLWDIAKPLPRARLCPRGAVEGPLVCPGETVAPRGYTRLARPPWWGGHGLAPNLQRSRD